MLTVYDLKKSLELKRPLIQKRLEEFSKIIKYGSDEEIFLELIYCIFTAGASAKMGSNAVEAVKNTVFTENETNLAIKLRGVYRFPNARSKYIVETRKYLTSEHNFRIKELIQSFDNPIERRDFFASNKKIKGIGFKESSHFLRNIGFKGYAIIDKHLLNCFIELGLIKNNKPPSSRSQYLELEHILKKFAKKNNLDFDELDLLLWSEKTGEILK